MLTNPGSCPDAKVESALAWLKKAADYTPAAFACSFGAEDVVLLDLIARHLPALEVFSLDTGRLPAETYALMQQVRTRYPDLAIRLYFPEAAQVEAYAAAWGPDAFYESVERRKECCHVRKVLPLQRALAGKKAWITGLRAAQAVTRQALQFQEHDAANGLEKFNPLADWSEQDVWGYIQDRKVPYNALHDRHYPSIGCAPCTRAVAVGEDIRAGRWWWENPEFKECGLHPAGHSPAVTPVSFALAGNKQ